MKFFLFKILLSTSLVIVFFTAKSQTLIMNEVSNGPSGNQEYVEFVVVSNAAIYNCFSPTPPCIDIRGWIFDDNSGYHGTSGVAAGAVRFAQNPIWACVPLGTIILIYNNADRNPAIPPDDLSMSDGNCTIIAPLNSTLFESNTITPGAVACSYPATGWTAGGNWNNTLFANAGDCARIVDLGGCEVFSVCWSSDNLNNLIYFNSGGSGSQNVWYFNGGNPTIQANWSEGSASTTPGNQTPGAPNNAVNVAYIAQFNNGCLPITQPSVTAVAVNAGCTCNGSATASGSGSIGGYSYVWYDASMTPIGQTSATATGLCAGVYNVVVTSLIGCTATTSVNITSSSTISATVNSQTVCAGASAILTATVSSGGGTFAWAPGGQTTSSISVLPGSTTTYSVTYTLSGCSATNTGVVNVTPLPTITVNSPTICSGQTATLTANGASTYSWNTGSTTNPLTVSATNNTSYTVTGTINGCTNTAVADVSVTPLPSITVNSPTICSGQTATLTANGASTYSWNTGSTTNPLIVSATNNTSYTVTGTINGCTNTAVADVSVTPLPTITVNSPTICSGSTTTLSANGATTYTWSTGSNNAAIIENPLTTTSYSVLGELSGCVSSATTSIIVNPNLLLSVNTPTICSGQTATLTSLGATTYTWSNGVIGNNITVSPLTTTSFSVSGVNGTCSGTTIATVVVNPLPVVTVNSNTVCTGQTTTLTASGAAVYQWNTGSLSNLLVDSPIANTTYTVIGTTLGCSNTAIASISVTPLPTITVNSNTICSGQIATLTANGASTYLWSTGVIANSISISPLSNTVISVSGSVNGCINTATTNVSVISNPTIAVNSSTVCEGASTNLTASGASSYSWNIGATTTSITVAPTTSTSYTVVGSILGCSNTAVAYISVVPIPTVTVNSSTICSGQTATLTANGANTYLWSNGVIGNQLTISPISNMSYSVVGTVNGCSSSSSAIVYVSSVPTLTLNSSTICAGETATLSVSGANSFLWNNGSITNAINVSPNSSTSYSVLGTSGLCSSTASTNVIVNQPPSISVTSSTICAGQIATLTANGASSYLWNTGSVSNVLIDSPNSSTVYTVTGTSFNCSSSTTVSVVINTVPNISFNSDKTTGCAPLCVQFTDLSSLPGSQIINWNWTFNNGYSSNIQNPSHCFETPGLFNISLFATASNGCSKMFTNPNMINVLVNPIAEFTPDTSETDILNPVINFTNLSTNANSYLWNFSGIATSTLTNPSYIYNQEGTYSTTLTATNQFGCSSMAIHDITVKGIFTFYAPNTFTPNDDNKNDVFLPLGVGWDPEKYQLDIFDRWGNNCFNTKEVGRGWDGKANNGSEAAQIDTYTWKVDLTDVFGKSHKYIGRVTIIR